MKYGQEPTASRFGRCRRRCHTALFALRAAATSVPFFPLCCCSAERRQPAAHHTQLYHRSGNVVGIALVSEGRLLPFAVRCSARCLASFLSRGLVLCLWRAGGAPVLCAAVCCVPFASALGSGRGGATRGLEVRGPVLQPQVGGLSARFVVEDRAQWRRGCDGPSWWPPGSCAGRAPLAADDGRKRRAVRCSRALF